MRELKELGHNLHFPVLLWTKSCDSVYLAKNPLELYPVPRLGYKGLLKKAEAGEWRLTDSDGFHYKVCGFERIKPFGGLYGVFLQWTGSVFAAPVLDEVSKPTFDELKGMLLRLSKSYLRYNPDFGQECQHRVKSAGTATELIAAFQSGQD